MSSGLISFGAGSVFGLLSNAFALLFLLLANKRADYAHFIIIVAFEIKTELLGRSKLHEVIIERLL